MHTDVYFLEIFFLPELCIKEKTYPNKRKNGKMKICYVNYFFNEFSLSCKLSGTKALWRENDNCAYALL